MLATRPRQGPRDPIRLHHRPPIASLRLQAPASDATID